MNRAGYTLVEILGAFFIMTIILTLVTGIFVENGRQRAASLGMMSEGLSAAAATEQIVADLEGALFVLPESGRPDEHPWRFVAEGGGELGADALRFVTQNAPLANRPEHASGWVEVAYFVEEDREGQRALWRWVSPRPPHEVDGRFPNAGDDGTSRLAVDVDDLGFRFRDLEGEWIDDWDSAYQPPDAPLPGAVEFNLRLLRDARVGETEDPSNKVPARLHSRRVVLPMPPMSVSALVDLAAGDEDEAACFTVADCLAEGDTEWYEEQLTANCEGEGGDELVCELLEDSSRSCWSEVLAESPSIANDAPSSCIP